MNSRQVIVIIVIGLITIILAGAAAVGLKSLKKRSEKPVPPKIVRKVNSVYVEYKNVYTQLEVSGRVISQQSVEVISEVQGEILQGDVPFKKGQKFNKNDVLIRIYNKNALYGLQARKSAFLNLLANILPDLRIDYPSVYPEWVKFFESVNLIKELPDLPTINTNQEKIFLASKNILSEYYAIKSDEIQLRKYSILAPYDGAIQDVLLEVGSIANPGSRIAQIIKTDQLEIEVPVEVSDASWLKIGDLAMLKSESGQLAGTAKIKRISPYVDAGTQSINIYLSVQGKKQMLFPGEYLRVQFSGMLISNSMEIPRNAVFNRNEVFIIENGVLKKRQVSLQKVNENTIIFNGLKEGIELVTEPLANATEGMLVQSEYTKPSDDKEMPPESE
ncbi:MAG: efflux RND transporter periplasmic adaptor subunit [Bacteroidales bacterium]|nr:efflux RND transporter periplasmic adaptor subunit [Bacteroidales bacterium]